ncbi:MAG: XRE family transcriptional regulator [Candidatus Hydrogenedentes bacterium]|nr:XRE family transcriptional regulator [Candidatus Hydrogenedentota bacterium]
MKKKNKHIGSSFDDYLAEEGILEECEAQALKEILAMQVEKAMQSEGLTKTAMATRMRTSRPALDRLLDDKNTSVTLHTLQRAAAALGKRVRLELIEPQ